MRKQFLDRIVVLDEGRLDHDIAEALLDVDALPEHVLGDALVMGHAAGDELEQIVEAAADQVAFDDLVDVADGAYDGAPIYATIAARGEQIKVAIPPRADAVLSKQENVSPSRRDGHIAMIAAKGRLGWQEETDYGRRALVETTMGRYKTIIGPTLRARCLPGQRTEAAIGVVVLNRMLLAGRPKSARITQENS